jgi:hypothetical protein
VLIEEVQPYITASIAAEQERLKQAEAEAEAERQRKQAEQQRERAAARRSKCGAPVWSEDVDAGWRDLSGPDSTRQGDQ